MMRAVFNAFADWLFDRPVRVSVLALAALVALGYAAGEAAHRDAIEVRKERDRVCAETCSAIGSHMATNNRYGCLCNSGRLFQ